MKRIVSVIIACILVISLAGCDENSNRREGEAKTPSSSNTQKGRDYQEVINDFEKKGFRNIKVEKLEDLITGWITKDGEVESVSVDGNDDYSSGVWYPNDVEVVIIYHTFPEDDEDPEPTVSDSTEQVDVPQDNHEEAAEEALESTFPVENAKRAAVVAITNYYAIDVFSEDGNTYDVSKFHSYEDTSGNFYDYYMKVESWGAWSAKDEQTWYVDSIKLENSYGNVVNASLDVSFDGSNYVVSNITGTFGQSSDLSIIETMRDASLFLTIPPELIKNDRSQVNIDTHRSWVNNQFSSYDGSHKELKRLIIKNLNDEKSFKHIETSYQEIFAEDIKDDINEILKSSNKEARVEIGDLWITTQFSAKNTYNATVKNSAYGIASFSNNTITLVAIE